jgi:hypothetical protein
VPPTPEPPPLKLEEGKRYVRADGEISSHLKTRLNLPYSFRCPKFDITYSDNGKQVIGKSNPADLVAEYVEPEPTDQATRLKQLESVVEAATTVIRAASIGDHYFVTALSREEAATLRLALVKLGDVLREVE